MFLKMLSISTANISAETARILDKEEKVEGLISYLRVTHKDEYGWFIPIYKGMELDSIPADMLLVIRYALKKKCDWIMLDRDEDIDENLPVYEW